MTLIFDRVNVFRIILKHHFRETEVEVIHSM